MRFGLGVLFVTISNLFAIYPAQIIRQAFDVVAEHINKTIPAKEIFLNQFMQGFDLTQILLFFGILVIVLALLKGLFMFCMRQTLIVMSRLIEFDLKNEVYNQYQKLSMSFYKTHNTGDLMNRISEDVTRVRMYLGPAIMYSINLVILFILVVGTMVSVNPKLTLYVLLPLPILSLTIYYVSNIINRKSEAVQRQLSKLSTHTQEAFSGIRVLKAYTRESSSVVEFDKECEIYKEKSLDLVKVNALFHPFMILLIGLSTLLTIYIGGIEAIAGNITMGNIAEFVIYVNMLTWPVASLGWVTSIVQRAAASQERINEFLNEKPDIISPVPRQFHPNSPQSGGVSVRGDSVESAETLSPSPSGNGAAIEFLNVNFIYPDSGIKALDNVSLKVNPGNSLAILGRTGSGKSTIAHLITRLYDVTSGEILLDGKNIKKIELGSLRSNIGFVPQDVFLFSDSIANNIAWGSPSPTLPKGEGAPTFRTTDHIKQVEQAAKDAAIYDNIIEFPQGFNTTVGERGVTLSGGQKQRVSIARAIIKNPQLLIFDDCLSAIDTETEEEILSNLKRVMRDKTTIIISHRVSSVKHSDQIIMLDEGHIIERGDHTTLLERKGVYHDLYQKQLLEEETHQTVMRH